jgi:hypothetical protein
MIDEVKLCLWCSIPSFTTIKALEELIYLIYMYFYDTATQGFFSARKMFGFTTNII